MANIIIAYFFWLLGGPSGLHHFYLGRDNHAFVWWISLGGLFLGWFRDLWRLPEYVYEANRDHRVRDILKAKKRQYAKPPWKVVRFAGQVLIGSELAYLFRMAIPQFVLRNMENGVGKVFLVVLLIMVAATGVNLVANIGLQKVALKWCILGATISTPCLLLDNRTVIVSVLFASFAASYKVEWDVEKEPPSGTRNFFKRVFVLTICGCIYLSLWTSVIHSNVHLTRSDGVQVPIFEAVGNFFKLPACRDFNNLYEFCRVNTTSWDACFQQLKKHLVPTREEYALMVLGFEGVKPNQDEINTRCRKMSRKYHPDKFKTEAEKLEANDKFIEIQKACDTLSEKRQRRMGQNMKSQTTETPPHKDRNTKPKTKQTPPHKDHRKTEFKSYSNRDLLCFCSFIQFLFISILSIKVIKKAGIMYFKRNELNLM